MFDNTLKCRVCGKEYEACLSKRVGNAFRWQDVACSPECGSEYFHRIQISRGLISNNVSVASEGNVPDEVNIASIETDDEVEAEEEFDSDNFGE